MIRRNKLWDDLSVGDSASLKRQCTANDLYVFAHASGNLNPLHLPNDEHDNHEAVAPSMWVGSLFSSVIGNSLPGPGSLYRSQTLEFMGRARIGDELTVTVTVAEKLPDQMVRLDTQITNDRGRVLCAGVAEVQTPTSRVAIEIEEGDIPEVLITRHAHFDRILEEVEGLDPIPTAVIAPEEPDALGGALLAAQHGIIKPILIGSRKLIEECAAETGDDLSGIEIIDEPRHDKAAAAGVAMARAGQVGALMKGHLHTSDLLSAILKKGEGLRTGRRLSHAFIMDVPGLDHLLVVTDAAVNIAPTLMDKVDICQNAIDLCLALGMDQPKVGVLSAVETVNPAIQSTLDAAALSKMADRGQIKGGLVDGPLAMDNAMDVNAARTKGITSLVAGRAEVLLAPNLEAGNMLAKELTFVAHAEAGGLVLGARVPVIVTSRADGEKARLASCAVAALYSQWLLRNGRGGH